MFLRPGNFRRNNMAFVPDSMFRNHEDYGHFLPSTYAADDQKFQGVPHQFLMNRSTSYTGLDRAEEPQPEDDMSDDGCQLLGEKKRRLNMEQVKALEKSFELGNKLEPERKMQLARALGLQPRQIAIWFQNRRARWKTKQLEKDYDVLRRKFESLKADNDALKSLNKELHSQLLSLKSEEPTRWEAINLNNDNEGVTRSNGSDDKSCVVNLNNTTTDSTLYLHPSDKHAVVFPPSVGTLPHLLGHKVSDHTLASNEPFTDTFGGVEENPGFWPWPGQQNFQ